ncbi:MAG: hypothetical protein IJZ39_03710 [Oscillospiraceae bacterium]|nr:hypothetical protein [Oscillospiraceae bacterium]
MKHKFLIVIVALVLVGTLWHSHTSTSTSNELTGTWFDPSTCNIFYIGEDNTIHIALDSAPEGKLLIRTYEISGDTITLTYADEWLSYWGNDPDENTSETHIFHVSDNILYLDGEEWIHKLVVDPSVTPSIIGTWQLLTPHFESFYFSSGYYNLEGDSISFYSDGTFQIDEDNYGNYNTVFDGKSLYLGTDKYGTYKEFGPYSMRLETNNLLFICVDEGITFCFSRID